MTSDQCPKCGSWFSTSCCQGDGKFIYDPEGLFDALDAIEEAHKALPEHADYDGWRAWERAVNPYMCSAQVCVVCGHIFGQAGPEQMMAWGIKEENAL